MATEAHSTENANLDRQWSSSNDVPWRLCAILQRLATMDHNGDRELIEQDALVSIFIGMNAIEVFTNIYARNLAEEPWFVSRRAEILKSIEKGAPTGKKLELIGDVVGHPIDQSDSRWIGFHELRELRNDFVHFKSSYDEIYVPGISMQGLVETTQFAALNIDTPTWVISRVRGIVELVGLARGVSAADLIGFVRGHLGLH